MNFIIALSIVALWIRMARHAIKKQANVWYLCAVALAAMVAACTATGVDTRLPGWAAQWIWPLFSKGALATALFVAVMLAGALPRKSSWLPILMPIRGELSIIASILTLGHNLTYGPTYFNLLFFRREVMTTPQLWAALLTIAMLVIMIPLFITSFPSIRRRMVASQWKRLQQKAYYFYGMIYLHVMLLTVPGARLGKTAYIVTALAYSVVFLGYAAMRLSKAFSKASHGARLLPTCMASVLMVGVCGLIFMPMEGQALAVTAQNEQMQTSEVVMSSDETWTEANRAGAEKIDVTAVIEPESESEVQPEVKSESKPEVKPESKPEAKPESKPESKPEAKPESKPEVKPEIKPEVKPEVKPESKPEVHSVYTDGVYNGSGEGFVGPIAVRVTIKQDKITAISVVSSTDDEPYFSDSKAVIGRIIGAQSTRVDVVSGATYSSKGIINGVEAALKKARH